MVPKHHTLSQVLRRFKQLVDDQVAGRPFWLKAEISQVRFSPSGHIYLELAETRHGETIAQCQGVIWSAQAAAIRSKLGDGYREVLKQGNEVLIEAEISFDLRYGLKMVITDLDLGFLLGEIERRRQETLKRLVNEGVAGLNRQLSLARVVQRIALVASPSTAGYEDFVRQLDQNEFGYRFDLEQFPSPVQGELAIPELVGQLQAAGQGRFDAVILIRGGGSKMDLDIFNAYALARAVAECPVPVLTGIGHETDQSVADQMAHRSFKTPTAVAGFLLNRLRAFEDAVEQSRNGILEFADRMLENNRTRLERTAEGVVYGSVQLTQLKRGELHRLMQRITQDAKSRTAEAHHRLRDGLSAAGRYSAYAVRDKVQSQNARMELLEIHVRRLFDEARNQLRSLSGQAGLYSPKEILKRGYVIPRHQGTLYRGDPLAPNSPVELEFADRRILVGYLKLTDDEHEKT